MKVLYYDDIVEFNDKLDMEHVTFDGELKANLAASDYIAIKIAEGAATREEYADKIAEREHLRELIRALEE